jgi:hypothetical protein
MQGGPSWTPQDEGRQLAHSSRTGTGRYDRFRKPSRHDRYFRIAVVHCLVFARQRSPNQPDEAWCLASEGARELKVCRELRCQVVGRTLVRRWLAPRRGFPTRKAPESRARPPQAA